jgi:hypothetical protein
MLNLILSNAEGNVNIMIPERDVSILEEIIETTDWGHERIVLEEKIDLDPKKIVTEETIEVKNVTKEMIVVQETIVTEGMIETIATKGMIVIQETIVTKETIVKI